MKKIFVIIFLFFISLPVFAANLAQQKLKKEFWSNPTLVNKFNTMAKTVFIWQDYYLSKNDTDSDTYFNDIIKTKAKYCSQNDIKSSKNCKYSTKVSNNFIKIGELNIFEIEKFEKATDILNKNPIVIDDSDIQYLDKDLIQVIVLLF